VAALSSTVPDSGTAGRLMTPAMLGAGTAIDPTLLLKAGVAWGGAKALYSKPGVDILTGNTRLQRALAKMEPGVRKAFLAALRAQQAGTANQ
jgi:hypothetical protein